MLSVLLYAAETWTLLDVDSRALEAFHMKCQRQLLQIKWHQFIQNEEITKSTGLPSISESISHRRKFVTLSFVTSPGCKRTCQRTRHATATLIYRSDVRQVAYGVITQAVLATDELTRFGGTTASRPLTSVSRGHRGATRRYGLHRLSVNDDDDDDEYQCCRASREHCSNYLLRGISSCLCYRRITGFIY